MRLCSIASGSSGNCTYISSDTTELLIDTGISKTRVENGLRQLHVNPEHLQGILITHEHSDHIRGLGVMARRYHLPIYATPKTIDAIRSMGFLGKIDDELYCPIQKDETFLVGDIQIQPFGISHDAADPVAYRFRSEGKQIGVATDMGTFDEYIVDNLRDLDSLLLEANHDVRMLQTGSYPYYLKLRILGSYGHLSNDSSAQLLCRVVNPRLQSVLLGHLSQENNMEEIAFETVRQEVARQANEQGMALPDIRVAHRDRLSHIVEI